MTTDSSPSGTTVAIVGGYGKIARLLHPLLLAAGHTPVALVRKEEQADDLRAQGVEVRMLDIEAANEKDFEDVLRGVDAVVFAAGGGADGNAERKRTVDLAGSLKSISGARKAGVSRFVQISAIGVDNELPEDTDDVWRAYVEAKRDADTNLRESDLDWTIIRPGRLTDDAARGTVTLAPETEKGAVTRADVAAVIAAVIDEPGAFGAQWDLVEGDTPIADAVRQQA